MNLLPPPQRDYVWLLGLAIAIFFVGLHIGGTKYSAGNTRLVEPTAAKQPKFKHVKGYQRDSRHLKP